MGTGASLTAPERIRRLQTVLHAKAKEAPGYRFHTLKVWRDDVLMVAGARCAAMVERLGWTARRWRTSRRGAGAVAWGTGAGAEGRDLTPPRQSSTLLDFRFRRNNGLKADVDGSVRINPPRLQMHMRGAPLPSDRRPAIGCTTVPADCCWIFPAG